MKRLLFVLTLIAVTWTSSCSGGGSTTPPPPPTGGFTNASLKGTYVFSITGTAVDTNTDDGFSRVGIFIADGGGNIVTTGGVEDVHKFGANNTFDITGGSYVVNADGRGSLCLETSGGMVQYSISLAASSTGYMVDLGTVTACTSSATITDSETASGSFSLQSSTTLSAGTYVFDFSGIDPGSGNPLSIVGDFVASASGIGSFSAGSFEDINDGGTIITKASVAGGGYATDNANPGTGRGLATLNGLNYVYYVIDTQHVQFMEIDADQVVAGTNVGEAVAQQAGTPTQTSSFNNSSFVFVMGGSGIQSLAPLARAGRLTATGGALSAILLDNNNAGKEIAVPTSGVLSGGTVTLDGDGSGRGTFAFTDTINQTGTYTFVFYLSSATQGVIQDVSTVLINNVATPVDVADGTLLAQTGAPFASAGLATSYAFSWSGVSTGEEDFVGSFKTAGTNPNGLVDYNEFGVSKLFFDTPFNGAITVGGDGTGSSGQHSTFAAALTGTPAVTINYFAYIANPSTILVMGTGTNRVIVGVLTAQTQ
jgi:hypothetical protein